MRITFKCIFVTISLILISCGCTPEKPASNESTIIEHTIKSKIIDGNIKITVYLPKGYNSVQKYPVLYTLHGASGNEWQWLDDLNAKDTADKLINMNRIKPLIIVSTSTFNSLTLSDSNKKDNTDGKDLFEEYVCKELVPYIDRNYKTIKSNNSRYLGGISMGGFIALQIALHHPKLFGKVGGHSPASWIVDYSNDSFDKWLYSGEFVNKSEDPREIAREKGLTNIKVYLDCGEDDFGIVDDTKNINDALLLRGLDVKCVIGKGAHTPEYWQSNMEKYLEFYGS